MIPFMPVKSQDPKVLVEALEIYGAERKRIRRRLCKYLRTYQNLVTDRWLLRKIGGGWLGDLSDFKLIAYCQDVISSSEE